MSDLSKFLSGEVNVIKANLIITREKKAKSPQEYIHIMADDDSEIYSFWRRSDNLPSKGKGTGGKKPYVMLMLQRLEELQEQNIPNFEEIIGVLVLLSKNIEWSTGRLINKRSKQQLKYEDLIKLVTFSSRKLDKLISVMKQYKLISNTSDGYFISQSFIKKGSRLNGSKQV